MTEYKYTWLMLALVIWPIIVNSQPGTTFSFLGIDWKSNDLDGVLFWIGIAFFIIFLLALGFGQTISKDSKKKDKYGYGPEDQERNI